jgi:O-acetyl-ADP-ribose deacetylase (regulator of RNase III)
VVAFVQISNLLDEEDFHKNQFVESGSIKAQGQKSGKHAQNGTLTELQINGKYLKVLKADITERDVDAIVNAANSYLQHGGGVAAVIVRKGGAVIQQESNKIGYVPVGSAVMTTAGKLRCKAVIHTVGPRMGEGNEDEKLKQCVVNVLRLAAQHSFATISIPAISSGIFGFPKDRCAKILIGQSKRFLQEHTTLNTVEFCLLDDQTLAHFQEELNLAGTNPK